MGIAYDFYTSGMMPLLKKQATVCGNKIHKLKVNSSYQLFGITNVTKIVKGHYWKTLDYND